MRLAAEAIESDLFGAVSPEKRICKILMLAYHCAETIDLSSKVCYFQVHFC